jgi:hypothetical protein
MNTEAKAKKADPVVETVTMTDGRNVDFVGKRKILKESLISEDGTQVAVRIDFRNAETRTFALPTALMNKFAAHGAEQKLGDEVAGVEDVDDCVLAIDALIERLGKGEWSVQREAGGMSGASILLKALVEFSGKSVEDIKKFLADKTQADKVALRNSAKVKPIVERLEAEKAAKAASKGGSVDADALLGQLA